MTTNPGYGPNGSVTRPGAPDWTRENAPPKKKSETITKPNSFRSFGSNSLPFTGLPDKRISKPVGE